jgi:WD40 repeat protein
VFYLVKYPETADARDRIRGPLPKDSSFVGFTPDGKQVVTALREYGLLSGYHHLIWWDPSKSEETAVPNRQFVLRGKARFRVVDFDGADLHGYAFTADGKTLRTIRSELDVKGGLYTREVVEVDLSTGKTGKVILKLDPQKLRLFPVARFSPDGKRLAAFNQDYTKVTVYDLDRGAKLSEYKHPRAKPDDPLLGLRMAFSQDGKRLVVARGLTQTFVIKTDTGEALPELEGLATAIADPAPFAFSGDGRLLAMRCENQPPPMQVVVGSPPHGRQFLAVWDTQTGKVVKSWDGDPIVAFSSTRPVLAMLEANSEETRIGFWDFSAEAEKK